MAPDTAFGQVAERQGDHQLQGESRLAEGNSEHQSFRHGVKRGAERDGHSAAGLQRLRSLRSAFTASLAVGCAEAGQNRVDPAEDGSPKQQRSDRRQRPCNPDRVGRQFE